MKNYYTIITLLFVAMFMTHVNADTFNVTTTDDPTPNGCNINDCSLREAFTAANAAMGFHTINLPACAFSW